MYTCGMYDAAGQWAYEVGVPAKSGVSGGILAVVPGKLGIGVFSPGLDVYGNSVRGIGVCYEIATQLGVHVFAAEDEDALLGPGGRRTHTVTRPPRTRSKHHASATTIGTPPAPPSRRPPARAVRAPRGSARAPSRAVEAPEARVAQLRDRRHQRAEQDRAAAL